MHLQQATDAASAARMHTVHRPTAHHGGSLLSANAKSGAVPGSAQLQHHQQQQHHHHQFDITAQHHQQQQQRAAATPPAMLADQVAVQRALQLLQLQHMVHTGGQQSMGGPSLDAYTSALQQQYLASALTAAAAAGDVSYCNELLAAASRPALYAAAHSPAAVTSQHHQQQYQQTQLGRDRFEPRFVESPLSPDPLKPSPSSSMDACCTRKQRLALLDEHNLTEDELLAVAVLAGLNECDRRMAERN